MLHFGGLRDDDGAGRAHEGNRAPEEVAQAHEVREALHAAAVGASRKPEVVSASDVNIRVSCRR